MPHNINRIYLITCVSDPEGPSAQSTPSEEAASVLMNGEEPPADLNGHIPVRKRYIESSLDELALEIEAYEANEDRPKPVEHYHNGDSTDEPHAEPESPKEPPVPVVVIAPPQAGPSYEKVEMEEPVEEPVKTPVEVQSNSSAKFSKPMISRKMMTKTSKKFS